MPKAPAKPKQPTATISCNLCGASATFVGPTAFEDMMAWDKSHGDTCTERAKTDG